MKVFLANIEADFVIEGSKPKYYLESYFYLKKTNSTTINARSKYVLT